MNKLNWNVRVSELSNVSDTIIRFFKASEAAEDKFLLSIMAEIEQLSNKLSTFLNRTKIVSGMKEASKSRLNAVSSLRKLVLGYSVFPDEEKKSASLKILEVLHKYKNIASGNYASQTSSVKALLRDLSESQIQKEIAKLDGVSALVENVRESQKEFENANDIYNSAIAVKDESATKIKKPLLDVLNMRLVPYLSAVVTQDEEIFSSLCKSVSQTIDSMNLLTAKRKRALS